METRGENNAALHLQRRLAISAHPEAIGLDFIEVEWQEKAGNLRVHFVPPASSQPNKQPIPPNLTPANFAISTITGEVAPFEIGSLTYIDDASYLILGIALTSQDFDDVLQTLFFLSLLHVDWADRHLSLASFSLEKNLKIDPQSPTDLPPLLRLPVEINYLAKDYESFRHLMLDYLTLLLPQWPERHEADLGIVLVDLLAYVADYLSYYQDAVATESYLGTARRRLSLSRHARLLDYTISQGCNARVWVQVQVKSDTVLPIATPLLAAGQDAAGRILPHEYRRQEANNSDKVFETMERAHLYVQHNLIYFYTAGASQYSLKKGATRATLIGHFPNLQQGDVLIFEEVMGTETDLPEDADRKLRHAVRLSQKPKLSRDRPYSQAITEIEWALEDRLPFDLPIAGRAANGRHLLNRAVVRGNIVLADCGQTNKELLSSVPAREKYRPQLSTRQHLTYRVSFNAAEAQKLSARKTLQQNPLQAQPAIILQELGAVWQSLPPEIVGSNNIWLGQRDLLESGPFGREFVAETEEDCRTHLRFGDGRFGQMPTPGHWFCALYRVGNGTEGNVGPETIATIVSDDLNILGVRNLMTARGGVDPEPLEEIRLNAPVAFHTQQRCVTEEDYATRAEQYFDIFRAIATRQWTGSWYTIFIHVLRHGDRPVDRQFAEALEAFISPWAMVGTDLAVVGAQFVPVSIVLEVSIAPGAFGNQVLHGLQSAFSGGTLANGEQGFFHRDRFTFGQPLYLSQIVARALEVQNVIKVEATQFQKFGNPSTTALKAGAIRVSPLEVIQVLNKAGEPEKGSIQFKIEGTAK